MMPPVSKAQNRLMQAVAHDPKVAKATGIAQKVGKEMTKGHFKASKLPARASKKKGKK